MSGLSSSPSTTMQIMSRRSESLFCYRVLVESVSVRFIHRSEDIQCAKGYILPTWMSRAAALP